MRSESSAGAIDGMAPALSGTGFGIRLASALVLIPVALLAAILGSPFFDLLVILAGVLMAWEWARLIGEGRLLPPGALGIGAVAAAAAAVSLLSIQHALVVLVAGALLTGAVSGVGRGRGGWYLLGVLYAGLPCCAVLWLRSQPMGSETVLWLFGLVWATDTGAYLAGRSIGGPKLMPAVSPNKTWSGLIGGMTAAAVAGAVGGLLIEGASPARLAVSGAVLAVVAQAGDLTESALKRRFGAKDSSRLIPGHGGVLDRVDGLVTVVLATALAAALAGESIVAW